MLKIRKSKTEKGITLIALIITIVVLLILAIVAITSITNDGIISKAQNVAQKYNESQGNEQGILGGYEDFLNEAITEPEAIPGPVEPKVGQKVKYNVSYTDMYSSSKTFGETDGWRYLGKDELGNHLIISTGIPMVLYYNCNAAGGSAKWWDSDTTLDSNVRAMNGMLNNFDKIPFAQKASIGPEEQNTAIGAFTPSERTYNEEGYNAVGDYFKATEQPYSSKILKVRTLTNAEFESATNSAKKNNEGFKDLKGDALGLFDMQDLTGYSADYEYWLPMVVTIDATEWLYVVHNSESPYLSSSGAKGIRPVVVLKSGVQFTDADGVLEIN